MIINKIRKMLGGLILPIFILSNCINAYAINESNGKEEVIYIMTNLDGTTKYIYAVNIFEGGEIIDHGNYSRVKILNTNDPIVQNEDTIEIKSNAEKIYYEGTMANNEIPWNISVKYFLDGKEIFGNELGGKSGHLKIKLDISKNDNFTNSSFYDNFALQVMLRFDTEISKNIKSMGATVANIGKKKQLLYTILPGKGIETEIDCDVVDFQMDAIEINGVKMDFNIEVDSSSVNGEVDSLKNGIAEIDNGSKKLRNSINDAKNGGNKLNDGVGALVRGSNSLDEGIDKFKAGIESARQGFQTLNEKTDTLVDSSGKFKNALLELQKSIGEIHESTTKLDRLSSESAKINSGIQSIYEGALKLNENIGYHSFKNILLQKGLDIDSLQNKNIELSDKINSYISTISSTIQSLEQSGKTSEAEQLKPQIEILHQASKLLRANNEVYGGVHSYLDELKNGGDQLLSSLQELRTKYQEFHSAIDKISSNFGDITVIVSKFTDAINQLVVSYSQLDGGLGEYTTGVKKLYTAYEQFITGIQEISNGSKSLKNGINEFSNGTVKLTNGLNALYDGATKLNNGTTTLRNKTSNLNTKIEDKISELLANIKGDEKEITSFTSEKNKNIKSVQFVIKSDAIIKPKVEKVNEIDEGNIGFWKKFTNLFKRKN